MQATIAYLLTEQAQRAQMAATGQPVARKQTTTEDIPSDLITHPLVQIGESGEMLVDLSRDTGINRDGTVACSWRSESGWAIIRAGLDYVPTSGVEAVRQRIAEVEEKAAKLRLDAAESAKREADAERRRYADLARQDEERTARNRENAAREQAKTDYIADYIAEHADEPTQQQFADGLLCRSVALSMIADTAFAAAGVPEAAEYDDDFCRNNDCPCGSKDLDCLPRSVYPAWQKIKAGLPEGCTVSFSRVRECLCSALERGEISPDEAETAGPAIYLAEIRMPHGPFAFERTVRLEK